MVLGCKRDKKFTKMIDQKIDLHRKIKIEKYWCVSDYK